MGSFDTSVITGGGDGVEGLGFKRQPKDPGNVDNVKTTDDVESFSFRNGIRIIRGADQRIGMPRSVTVPDECLR